MLSAGQNMKALRASRRGSVAFEFALITPLLLSLIVGGLEFSFILSSYSAIQQGVDHAAREIAINKTGANAIVDVKSVLPAWLKSGVAISVSQSNLADARLNVIRVTATAPATSATPIAIFSNAYPWTLRTEVVVAQELPFVD